MGEMIGFMVIALHCGATEEEIDKMWKIAELQAVPSTPAKAFAMIRELLERVRSE